MEQKNEQQPERIPKRVIYIGAVILLCAAIYVFVGFRDQEAAAVPAADPTALLTEAPATPVPTLIPLGKTLPVVLEELRSGSISVNELDDKTHTYSVAVEGFPPVTLIFSMEYRFVTAFSLQFDPLSAEDGSTLEAALSQEEEQVRYAHVKQLLPALIDAVDLQSRLDYATKLRWVELAQSALTTGNEEADKLEGCLFSAFALTSGETLVSVSFS